MFTSVIYFHNVSQFSNRNLSITRSRRTEKVGKPPCFSCASLVTAARRWCKLGALPPGACLMEGWGGGSWLPFYSTTLCLIHPKPSYYGHTRVPPILKLQLLIGQCRAAPPSPFLLCCQLVHIKKLQIESSWIWWIWGCGKGAASDQSQMLWHSRSCYSKHAGAMSGSKVLGPAHGSWALGSWAHGTWFL